jgi:indole-3-glycerol phosphate synthase
MERRAAAVEPRRGAFRAALVKAGRVNVIAECKRRSPSRGVLRRDYAPAAIASSYERAGAAAISVLTEPAFFDGSLDHLVAVRQATQLPLLRKDFIVDRYQIFEARAAGADAVLLIVAGLTIDALAELHHAASDAGLDGWWKFTTWPAPMAIDAGASSSRQQCTQNLAVDTDVSQRAVEQIPKMLQVAERPESGR